MHVAFLFKFKYCLRNRKITWEKPTASVTEVSLVFRDYGYIAASDFTIFYNDSLSTVTQTIDSSTNGKSITY